MTQLLISVTEPDDIVPAYGGTPIGDLLSYHNLGAAYRSYTKPEIIIGTCMDYRIDLRIPQKFAYILRTGGGNLRGLEFPISYALAVGKVSAICLIGHDQCAMTDPTSKRQDFVRGLVEGSGWSRQIAEDHFDSFAALFEIGDSVRFTLTQALYLRRQYPKVTVAPLIYRLGDSLLYQIDDSANSEFKS